MKKISLITLLIATSVANATPENSFYIGANVGASHSVHSKYENKMKLNNTDATYSILAGYKFNPYFAAELAVGHLGKSNATAKKIDNLHYKYNYDAAFALAKVIFPATADIDLYAKAGIGYIKTKHSRGADTTNKTFTFSLTQNGKNTQSFPVAIGAEYAIMGNLTANIEYQYINYIRHNLADKVAGENKIPKDEKQNYKTRFNNFKPGMHSAKVGLTYYFGATQKEVTPAASVKEPQLITLASEALFNPASTQLSDHGIKIINELAEQIKQQPIKNQSIIVSGHTDRLGSAQFNLKFSEKRAHAVAEQLKSRDINNITSVGYGFEHPITDDHCTYIKERKALIECYAPDRRIEIKISEQKK